MYKIIFHNGEGVAASNVSYSMNYLSFTDAAKNIVTIPFTSVKMIIKTPTQEEEEKKNDDESGDT